jgi:DNA-binding beta-propeller fold protein YncE
MLQRVLSLLALHLWMCGTAFAQIAVSSNDNKVRHVNGVNTIVAGVPDTATIVDLGAMPPRVVGEVRVPGGWSAPPQSVAVTPDESLALVASSTAIDPSDSSKTVPNDVVSVVDLRAAPPAVIATLRTGARASGVSINKQGTLALVANRGEGTVSVLAIAGKDVRVVGKVDLRARDSHPSLPVFAPDGRTAYVTRNGDHRVSVLSVTGATVSYAGTDISANLNPYSLEITPDGAVAVTGNIGNGPTGGADTLSVLDLRSSPPRLVNTVSVGLIPEGVAMSPDGRHVAAVVMNGSNLARSSPFFNDFGLLRVYRLEGTALTHVADVRTGHWCQGAVWNRAATAIVVQCGVEHELQAFRFDGRTLTPSGRVPVSGSPTGIRTAPSP